jgi:hypothetical protein
MDPWGKYHRQGKAGDRCSRIDGRKTFSPIRICHWRLLLAPAAGFRIVKNLCRVRLAAPNRYSRKEQQ